MVSSRRDMAWILVWITLSTSQETQTLKPELEKCCTMGEKWSTDPRNGCDNFPVPVPDIAFEVQVSAESSPYDHTPKRNWFFPFVLDSMRDNNGDLLQRQPPETSM